VDCGSQGTLTLERRETPWRFLERESIERLGRASWWISASVGVGLSLLLLAAPMVAPEGIAWRIASGASALWWLPLLRFGTLSGFAAIHHRLGERKRRKGSSGRSPGNGR